MPDVPPSSHWAWPPIEDALRKRLALSIRELEETVDEYMALWPTSVCDDAFVERALGYPWTRPEGSFVLDQRDQLGPITSAHTGELSALARGDEPAAGQPRRYPLLAIGSNGAPDTLIRKFEFLPAAETRVLGVAGRLHDFDVGATARIAVRRQWDLEGVGPERRWLAARRGAPGRVGRHGDFLWRPQPR